MNKTEIDLMREYVRVVDMCGAYNKEFGTDIKPWECVRYNGASLRDLGIHAHLKGVPNGYEFAVAIVACEPVFVGQLTLSAREQKRTFEINGVELPCPDELFAARDQIPLVVCNVPFWFSSLSDRDAVRDALFKLLTDARDKP